MTLIFLPRDSIDVRREWSDVHTGHLDFYVDISMDVSGVYAKPVDATLEKSRDKLAAVTRFFRRQARTDSHTDACRLPMRLNNLSNVYLLKETLADMLHCNGRQLSLLHNGRTVNDNHAPLYVYNIKSGDIIHVRIQQMTLTVDSPSRVQTACVV